MNKKIEVNSEIKEIKRLIEENEINKAEFKAFELAESIFPYKNNGDPYFMNECVNIISKIIMKECNKDSKEEIDIDYIINNFEELSKEVINVPEIVKATLKAEILEKLKSLR
ncbi:hypothetical protein, partial [Clostridium sp.]|uniref:hypothetical protein n=1 Tax=Clostridium sp. TaxID=1506 RepID=UPI00261960FE